jgi:hypothetical protein
MSEMKINMKNFYLAVLLVIVASSCLEREKLPDEPILHSHRFITSADSAVLYLDFTDGNGDFGLDEPDTSGVFSDCLRRYNLYAEYYELENGVWVWEQLDPCDGGSSQPFYFRVPWAKPTGQDQTQEGIIEMVFSSWYLPSDNDTMKFIIKIVDRSMNESNEVEVGPYVKIY